MYCSIAVFWLLQNTSSTFHFLNVWYLFHHRYGIATHADNEHSINVTVKQHCHCLFLWSSGRGPPFCSLDGASRQLKLLLKAALGSPGITLGFWFPSLHRGHLVLIWIFKKPTYLTDFLIPLVFQVPSEGSLAKWVLVHAQLIERLVFHCSCSPQEILSLCCDSLD